MQARDPIEFTRPFFRFWTKVAAFAIMFAVMLGVQAASIWTAHGTARDTIFRSLGTEVEAVARSAVSAVNASLDQQSDAAELGAILGRLREAHKLEEIALLTPTHLLADHRGVPTGTPYSIFTARPSVVSVVMQTGQVHSDRIELLGERYRCDYHPVYRDGAVACVLCLSTRDLVPSGLGTLDRPLELSVAVGVATAFAGAALLVVLMRFFDNSKRQLLRTARLANSGSLAAAIAHDVRNPMTSILGAARLLRRAEDLDDIQKELLDIITMEAKRADEQLDAFLDLTRETPLRLESEDLRGVVEAVVALCSTRAREAQTQLDIELARRPLQAKVDRRRMRQVIANLVINAIEAVSGAVPPESGRQVIVRVMSAPTDAGKPCMEITIADNGPGMSKRETQLALEPFWSSKPGGTGLGLSGAKQTVERHGGRLTIDSAPGCGTTVRIRLLPESAENRGDTVHADSDR